MKPRELIILGAGGHAREALWIARRTGQFHVIGFLDETIAPHAQVTIDELPVLPILEALYRNNLVSPKPLLVCAVGNNQLRKHWFEKFADSFDFATLIDPSAIIGSHTKIGKNCIIAPQCLLTVDIYVGDNVNLNHGCILTHDVTIKDHVFLGPGCQLSGGVSIQTGAELGTGVIVIPSKVVGAWSVVGAGTVVTRDIPPHCTAVGVPAKVIKYHK
jgi:sugar O-acyltransferase (sialic acid O-acetyltransferase NeuD family)